MRFHAGSSLPDFTWRFRLCSLRLTIDPIRTDALPPPKVTMAGMEVRESETQATTNERTSGKCLRPGRSCRPQTKTSWKTNLL